LLALRYYYGEGAFKDNVRAHMWLNISASQGRTDAQKDRDLLTAEMTSSQIEQAQNLARECVAKEYRNC